MSNADIVAEVIFEKLVEKDNFFLSQKEETLQRIKVQYEEYLYANLLALLDDSSRDEFDNLIDAEPYAKEKHDEFLLSRIPVIKDEVLRLTKNYVDNYGSFAGNLTS